MRAWKIVTDTTAAVRARAVGTRCIEPGDARSKQIANVAKRGPLRASAVPHRGASLGPMRILAHIHTRNDADVIGQLLDALLRQTRQLTTILIVDNASADATLDRTFPEQVTVIRNSENLGTSGAVRIGLSYALEHEFDWIWIFDADSVPEPDVLESLLGFFERLLPSAQEQVCFLGCWPMTATGEVKEPPILFKGPGITYLPLNVDGGNSRCDCTLWSGSLYRMAAVKQIGLPSADYVLDVAELEYGYRARQLGFTSYIVHNGVIHHDVGRSPGVAPRLYRLGPFGFQLYELSPIRCYYSVRNWIYFWVYQYKPRRARQVIRSILRSLAFTTTFMVRPVTYRRQLVACLRGIRDGLGMHMERRH
jgi:rhamnosyltransferase